MFIPLVVELCVTHHTTCGAHHLCRLDGCGGKSYSRKEEEEKLVDGETGSAEQMSVTGADV